MEITGFKNNLHSKIPPNFVKDDRVFDIPEDQDCYNFEEESSTSSTTSVALPPQINITPKPSPVKVKTAVKVFREIIQDSNKVSNSTLSPTSSEKMKRAIAYIRTKSPTVSKKLFIEILNNIPESPVSGKKRTITGEEPHAKRVCVGVSQSTIEETIEGSWLQKILLDLKNTYETSKNQNDKNIPLLVNEDHLGRGDRGFHLCSSAEKTSVNVVVENPMSGIWCGTFVTSNKKTKESTFFPTDLSFESLLKLLSHGEVIAKASGRALMQIPGTAYKVEMLLTFGGLVAHSCYPIWYYAPFDEKAKYDIFPSISYQPAEILAAGKKAIETNPDKCIYKLEDGQMVIDIASSLPNAPTRNGVYIAFPGNLDKV